ncbi:MAG: autotransporter outer membrane beta-barrel domain-containing protein [Phascolarctobacterium faecium]|uniref:autotransporter outer membrane beta-barrel domain-containing protein n=1 Tax=Phascolarctobacterium faecium TaxID=33025 RepID=UPI003999DCC1
MSIVEAAPVHETETVHDTTKSYDDGSTIIVSNSYAVYADNGETTNITITSGELTVAGRRGLGAIRANGGTINFGGDTVTITNNIKEAWSDAVTVASNGTLNFNNKQTIIRGDNYNGLLVAENSTASSNALTIDLDRSQGTFSDDKLYGMIVSNGSNFEAAGAVNINLKGSADDWNINGLNLWGNDAGGTVTFNDSLNITSIAHANADAINYGIGAWNNSTMNFNGAVNITVLGGSDNIGITCDGSTINAAGKTVLTVADSFANNKYLDNDKGDNMALFLYDNANATMGETVLQAFGGKTAHGLEAGVGSTAKFTDDLTVVADNENGNAIGIHLYLDSVLEGQNVSIFTNGNSSGAFHVVDSSQGTVNGLLNIKALGDENGNGLSVGSGNGAATFVGQDAFIEVSGANSIAILASGDGNVTFNGSVATKAAIAAQAEGKNGVLNLNGDFDTTAQKDTLIKAFGGGQIHINNSGAGTVKIDGKIKTSKDNKDNAIDLRMNNAASFWNMTAASNLTSLTMNNGAVVDMRADKNGYSKLEVQKLVGTDSIFKQDIDVRSMESDKIFVKDDFSGSQILDIYQKDNYVPAEESEEGHGLLLASTNGDGVFTAKDREGTLFYTHYDLANKQSDTAGYTTDWYLDKISNLDPGDKPTTSVDTILAANALNYHTWRTENDKLLQRMGELRHNGDEQNGAWFRTHGSKIGRSGKFGFENKYTAYELGYDELTKNTAEVKCYQGAALSYTDGSSGYSSGSGDNSNKAISFYTTEIGSKGHYLDVVFKISNMDNDFAVYDTNSNKITGDFNNTGVSLSAEYGRKNTLQNGWYIEPQAQFTLGYLGGDNYTTNNGIEVRQSGIQSAVGRLGFNIGKEVSSAGIVYAKANLLHEFGGGYDVSMRDSSGAVTVSDIFNDTWFEYGIGAALKTGRSSHLYFDVERSAGSDFKKDWQWNTGARWTF